MQETLPQPFRQHFWPPEQLESVLHWSTQGASMGIPGLMGGHVPGFSAEAKGHGMRPSGPGVWGSWRHRCAPASGCHAAGTPLPAGSFPTPQLCPLALPSACADRHMFGGRVARQPPQWLAQDTQP